MISQSGAPYYSTGIFGIDNKGTSLIIVDNIIVLR